MQTVPGHIPTGDNKGSHQIRKDKKREDISIPSHDPPRGREISIEFLDLFYFDGFPKSRGEVL